MTTLTPKAQGGGTNRIHFRTERGTDGKLTVYSIQNHYGTTFEFDYHPLAPGVGDFIEGGLNGANPWGSIATIRTICGIARKFIMWLDESFTDVPVESWVDPRLTPQLVRGYRMVEPSSTKRSWVRRIVSDLADWPTRHATPQTDLHFEGGLPVYGDAYENSDAPYSGAYTAEERQPILHEARAVMAEWRRDHMQVLDDLGLPNRGRPRLNVRAPDIQAAAERAYGIGPPGDPPGSYRRARIVVDLLHGKRATRRGLDDLRAAVRLANPDPIRRTAAAALLVHHIGLNATPIGGLTRDDLITTGDGLGYLSADKDRGRAESIPLGTSAYWLVREIIALTEFSRAAASAKATTTLERAAAQTLLVTRRLDVFSGKTYKRDLLEHGWPALAEMTLPRLRGDTLASAFLSAGQRRTVGQSEETGLRYLARILPPEVVSPIVEATQAALVQDAKESEAAALSRIVKSVHTQRPTADAEAITTSVADCTTLGVSPNDPTRPCDLGILGCLLCPMARVLPEHLPAVTAAREFAAAMRDDDPADFAVRGKALLLLAQATLELFPRTDPDAAAVARALPLVISHYRIHQTAEETA